MSCLGPMPHQLTIQNKAGCAGVGQDHGIGDIELHAYCWLSICNRFFSFLFFSGEIVCTATTSQKKFFTQLFKVAYDTESGRKVDLMLLVNNLEALNSEAKASQNRAPCERQYLKNLRINHAMHVVAAKKGVQLPDMNPLDIRGM